MQGWRGGLEPGVAGAEGQGASLQEGRGGSSQAVRHYLREHVCLARMLCLGRTEHNALFKMHATHILPQTEIHNQIYCLLVILFAC